MKKVTGQYQDHSRFIADMDKNGNLINIKDERPDLSVEEINNLATAKANQPNNGIMLKTAPNQDFEHTIVSIIEADFSSTKNPNVSDVYISKPEVSDARMGVPADKSDEANDAIFGKDGW